jgi:uncharacterized protein YecE (DUF72 family)
MTQNSNHSIRRYHLGLPVWKHKPWVGHFFRSDAKSDELLEQYSRVFTAVEGNSTFYGLPSEETIQRWKADTPDLFKFCFKMPRSVTHVKQLRQCEREVEVFLDRIEPLQPCLGPIMIQLPPSFGSNALNHLERFLLDLPTTFAYAVEVRHHDFYDHGRHEHHLDRILHMDHVDRVLFDTRRLHAIKHPSAQLRGVQRKKPQLPIRFEATGSRPVVRFVGHNAVDENEAYLKEWAIVVAEWIKEGLHPYVFIHAPDEYYAPENARFFHNELAKLINLDPLPPFPAEQELPNAGQLGLFGE